MADLARIERWIQKNRPDVVPFWGMLRNENSIILLMSIAYEAGFEAGHEAGFEAGRE